MAISDAGPMAALGGAGLLLAQAAPFDWGAYVFQTGGMGIALLVGYHLLKMNNKDRAMDRRARALIAAKFDEAMTRTQLVMLDQTEQSSGVRTLLEAIHPYVQINPSASTILNQKNRAKLRDDLTKKQDQLKQEVAQLQLEEEGSDADKKNDT